MVLANIQVSCAFIVFTSVGAEIQSLPTLATSLSKTIDI